MPSNPLLDARSAWPCRVPGCRGTDAGQRDRRLEQATGRVGVQQVGAELLAEPERPVGGLPEALGVEVGTGEPAVRPSQGQVTLAYGSDNVKPPGATCRVPVPGSVSRWTARRKSALLAFVP